MKCLLTSARRDRGKSIVTARCGRSYEAKEYPAERITGWASEVTCPECLQGGPHGPQA